MDVYLVQCNLVLCVSCLTRIVSLWISYFHAVRSEVSPYFGTHKHFVFPCPTTHPFISWFHYGHSKQYIVTNGYNVDFPLLINFRLNELRNTNKIFHNEFSVCKCADGGSKRRRRITMEINWAFQSFMKEVNHYFNCSYFWNESFVSFVTCLVSTEVKVDYRPNRLKNRSL